MNIKLKKLRVTNKKLKLELKGYKEIIIENGKNENQYLKKNNKEYIYKYYNLLQKDEVLEKDLSIFKRKLVAAETMTIDYKLLLKDYRENIQRLSKDIAILTKKNEYLESPGTGIANRIKNVFKRGKRNGSQHI